MRTRSRIQILLFFLTLLVPPFARAAYDVEWVEFPALKAFNGEAVQLSALQFRPKGSGPIPAVVLLHGCSGMYTPSGYITASYRRWAEMLSEEGYVALLVDSFRPRGHWSICELQKRPIRESRERVEDAYAAAQWLHRQSYVASDRIGLLGWSNGGTGTLYSMRPGSKMEPGFQAAVAFYPGCRTLSGAKTPYRPYSPLLILSGEADDWTPAEPCKQLAAIAQKEGASLEIITYPGAHHSFDRIGLPVLYRPNVRNLNKPDRLGATVGEHPQAREDAVKRTLRFFARTLKN
ncbi:MAG: dienelactone hydrolase family protein [Betaproteobacteria bacterium]|nr:dienelactone hydrolase family protein [Betaproteobacteria bacterium]